jgi:sugar/nucleoside kinase (ribokinase family)
MSAPFDLVVVGRPSVDVMFSGLHEWPALGKDIESDGLGVCAGTSFNTPAAANRIGLRVAYVATVGNDVWSRMIRAEFDAEGLPTDFLEVEDRPLPGISVALNLDGDRGFVTHWGSADGYDAQLRSRALEIITTRVDARHLHAYADEAPELEGVARRRGMTVSLDAWGGPEWSSTRPLADVLADADVLFANEAEAAAMTGEDDAESALDKLGDHCRCVVIKRGAAGALGLAGGHASRARGSGGGRRQHRRRRQLQRWVPRGVARRARARGGAHPGRHLREPCRRRLRRVSRLPPGARASGSRGHTRDRAQPA